MNGKLNFNFLTNLHPIDKHEMHNTVDYKYAIDYIAFKMRNGDRISLSYSDDYDAHCVKNRDADNNIYFGTYKGVEVVVEADVDADAENQNREILKVFKNYNELTQEIVDYLKTDVEEIYEIGVYFYTSEGPYIPECHNLNISLLWGNQEIKFHEDKVDVMTYGVYA